MTKIQIYGARRSGTNFTEHLLSQHPDLDVWGGHGGKSESDGRPWKHGKPRAIEGHHVIVVKDPYAWFVSNRRWGDPDTDAPTGAGGMEEWITHAESAVAQERLPAWTVVSYEEMLADPQAVASQIFKEAGVSDVSVRAPEKRMGTAGNEGSEAFDAGYYATGSYRKFLSKEDVATVSAALSEDLGIFVRRDPGDGVDLVDLGMSPNASGLGDLVLGIVVARSLKAAGIPFRFFTPRIKFVQKWLSDGEVFSAKKEPKNVIRMGRDYRDMQETVAQGGLRIDTYFAALPEPIRARARDAGLVPVKAFWGTPLKRAVVAPFSAYLPRTWQLDSYMRLVGMLQDLGVEVNILANPKKRDLIPEPMASLILDTPNHEDVVSAISGCDLLIGNDSGPVHIAGSLGVPAVCIHAMFSRSATTDHYQSVRSVMPDGDCVGCCGLKEHGYVRSDCAKRCAQLESITPEMVFGEIQKIA